MKSPTTTLNTQLTAQGSQPGYLVSIGLMVTGGVLRLCSLGIPFSFGGFQWLASDIEISGMGWDGSKPSSPTMTLGDPDQQFFTYAALGDLAIAPVYLWKCYAGAPGEAEPMWLGRIGAIRKQPMALICNLLTLGGLVFSPRRKVQDIIPPKYLFAAGQKVTINGQNWTIGM